MTGFAPPALAATATDAADRLFRAGHFAEADAAYLQILAHDPHNVHALAQHGSVALLANRLTEARDLLQRAVQQQPSDRLALQNLAATLRFGFETGGTISHAFFRTLAVTFDFLGMRLYLSGAARSCGSGR